MRVHSRERRGCTSNFHPTPYFRRMSCKKLSHLLWLKGVNLETGAQPTMTKAELVEEVTQLGDLTRRDGEVIVDTIFDAVIGALKSGDKIEIRGFGSFRIRQRKPRIGRNPKTGAKVEVPAKRVPYFKPSKELRHPVNPKRYGSPPFRDRCASLFRSDSDHRHHPASFPAF